MRPADDIKRFIDKAAVSIDPKADKAVLEAVLIAHEKAIDKASAAAKPSVRSIIMRNSYVKLALAAVVVLAVVLGLTEFLGPGGKSGVAWAQVLEKTEQAPTFVCSVTIEISCPQDKEVVLSVKNYEAGNYGIRSDISYDGQLIGIDYWLPHKKVAYDVRVDRKKYWRHDLSEEQARVGNDRDPRTWLKRILSGTYTKLGRTTLNGAAVEGIECKNGVVAGQDRIVRLWVDVKTNLPVRIEMEELHMFEGQMRPHKSIMENFEWDAPLDKSLFEPNIPPDYTLDEGAR